MMRRQMRVRRSVRRCDCRQHGDCRLLEAWWPAAGLAAVCATLQVGYMWPLNSGLALPPSPHRPCHWQCPLGRLQADSDGRDSEGHWRASAGTRRGLGGSAEAPTGRAGPASQRAQGPGPAPLAGQGAQLCYSAEARGHGRPGGANLNAMGHRRYELTPRRQRLRPSEAALAVAVAVRSHSKLDDRRSEAACSR